MAHRHTIGIRFTGPDVQVEEGHYHLLSGDEQTSVNEEGPRHTHFSPNGQETSGPLPLPDDDESHGRRHIDKKKKKKKKKKSY